MMKYFQTRVELHGSHHGSADYTKLHEEMEMRQFHRVIRSDAGNVFHLPPAEYRSYSDTLTAQQVRDLAVAAAQAAGYVPWPGAWVGSKTCTVIVAESPLVCWSGLEAA